MLDSRNSSIQQIVFKQKQSLSPSELEFLIQSQRDDCGCSKNCLSNLIQRFKPTTSSSSSINNNNNLTSFNVCQQIGHRNAASRQIEALASPFQLFVFECRQPFQEVICGTNDEQMASKQLRTYLVSSFEQANKGFFFRGKK